jgi:hypothetical protein
VVPELRECHRAPCVKFENESFPFSSPFSFTSFRPTQLYGLHRDLLLGALSISANLVAMVGCNSKRFKCTNDARTNGSKGDTRSPRGVEVRADR